MGIRIRRIHDAARPDETYRIYVDSIWPLEVPADSARVDEWLLELCPSTWLRNRFGRDPVRWGTFRSRYVRQLRSKRRRALLARIARIARAREVVLLHAESDADRNVAAVIREILRKDHTL